jgi:NAD(P)-dependent dehydrogenase (short-subunit alcohol dehydrogenase family)
MKDLFTLKNKVIIVTGACGLLGKVYSNIIAQYGGIPILIDLDKAAVNQLADEINNKFKVNSKGYSVNITREIEVKDNCLEIIKGYKKIDGLINNAANNPRVEDSNNLKFSRLENFNLDQWNNDLDVSLKGSFLCVKYYGYEISKNPIGGSIINISSDLGLIAPNQNLYKINGLSEDQQPVKPVTYSITKSGLIGLTRYVSTYWAEKNVRCNAICPGGIENNQSIGFKKQVSKLIPMRRMGNKNEISGALVYLLSDASIYVNGAVISVDGGRTAW